MDRRLKILVVDDNPYDRAYLADYLNGRGFDVIEAEHGAHAVDRFATHNFDLIFMDGQMPVMDGFEAAECMRQMEVLTGERHPIVLISGLRPEECQERSKRCEFDACLSKPIQFEKIRQIMARLWPLEEAAGARSET